jgi:chromosome partition protein MukE
MSSTFARLEEVLLDDLFPDVDLDLRRGRHVGREDGPAYDFLLDAQEHLEPFYRRYGAELVQRTDGYFFLLPSNDRLGRRRLTAGEMLVGQTLALLYLDPSTLQHNRTITRELLLQRLSSLVGTEVLIRTLNPRKRKYDERVAAETVRRQVEKAVNSLAKLGFIHVVDSDRIQLRPALMRFAEAVRGADESTAALERLIASGEIEEGEGSSEPEDDEEDEG